MLPFLPLPLPKQVEEKWIHMYVCKEKQGLTRFPAVSQKLHGQFTNARMCGTKGLNRDRMGGSGIEMFRGLEGGNYCWFSCSVTWIGRRMPQAEESFWVQVLCV